MNMFIIDIRKWNKRSRECWIVTNLSWRVFRSRFKTYLKINYNWFNQIIDSCNIGRMKSCRKWRKGNNSWSRNRNTSSELESRRNQLMSRVIESKSNISLWNRKWWSWIMKTKWRFSRYRSRRDRIILKPMKIFININSHIMKRSHNHNICSNRKSDSEQKSIRRSSRWMKWELEYQD